MRALTYFRVSLSAPLVLPIVAWGLDHWVRSIGSFSGFLLASIVIGGVPYLILAGALLWFSRKARLESFIRACSLAPLLMVGVFAPCTAVAILCFEGPGGWAFKNFLGVWGIFSLYTIGLGYVYVVLTWGVYLLLRRIGVVSLPHWLDGAEPQAPGPANPV